MKVAEIIPNFKKGDRTERTANYRPISLHSQKRLQFLKKCYTLEYILIKQSLIYLATATTNSVSEKNTPPFYWKNFMDFEVEL